MLGTNHNDKILWQIWLSRLDLAALAVADEINLFAQIQAGSDNVAQLAQSLALAEKGINALTTFLAAMDVLHKVVDKLELTEIAKTYLLPSVPAYWGGALLRAKTSQEYSRLLASLQKKEEAQLVLNGKNVSNEWQSGSLSYEDAKQFTSVMHATIYGAAESAIHSDVFANTKNLLDVGAGSGCFVSLFLKKYSGRLAGIFELPTVCRVAKEYLVADDYLARIKFFEGNFFADDFPSGFDGILFSNIFHDWPVEVAQLLIQKTYATLPSGGKIFIHEMLLDDQKNGPKVPAAFNLLMYMNHVSQQFTHTELINLLQQAGFGKCYIKDTHPFFSMVAGEKI